jgi:gluconokinase
VSTPTQHVVVMGVTGSGKTTVAVELARRTGYRFADADDFHPEANVDKMEAGTGLDDQDRQPWLERLARWMAVAAEAGEPTVLACSALKRSYRDLLRQGTQDVVFIHLDGASELITERMQAREDHFMPTRLLASQLSTLEPLQPDEVGTVLDITRTPEEIVDQSERWLTATDGAPPPEDRTGGPGPASGSPAAGHHPGDA